MKLRTLLAATLAVGALFASAAPAAAAPTAASDVNAAGGIGTYYITFRTGDLPNADTEDSVRITVFGDRGQSPPVQIDKDFPRGKNKTFGPFKWENIGNVGWIAMNKSGREKDAWYSEYVQVHEESERAVTMCEVGHWYPQNFQHRDWACKPL